jgi:hypothetical protein
VLCLCCVGRRNPLLMEGFAEGRCIFRINEGREKTLERFNDCN